MILPDYLTISVTNETGRAFHLLGETGMTLREAQRPALQLASWLHGEQIPNRAREVLESEACFAGIAGLLRVTVEQDGADGFRAVWVLARAPEGLVSVVVRDAMSASVAQLRDDARLSMYQARRYCARNAIVLVQSQNAAQSMSGLGQFAVAFDHPDVAQNRLYCAREDDGTCLGYAWLSPDCPKH